MFQSLRYSNVMLRFGLAAVFLWFGIDKFIHPQYWLDAWVPQNFVTLLSHLHVSGVDFIYLNGIFEVLVGASLVTNLFIRFFSAAAALFLVSIFLVNIHSFTEVLVRDFGLLGGFLSLFFWPDRRYP